jgi:hypothetical protein
MQPVLAYEKDLHDVYRPKSSTHQFYHDLEESLDNLSNSRIVASENIELRAITTIIRSQYLQLLKAINSKNFNAEGLQRQPPEGWIEILLQRVSQ